YICAILGVGLINGFTNFFWLVSCLVFLLLGFLGFIFLVVFISILPRLFVLGCGQLFKIKMFCVVFV
ncbi:hypothetical protein ACJBT7_10540, partial [Streptococcus suis]